MGDVYEGFDEKLRRRVALKVLHRQPGDRDARARLMREAHALSQLEHPNICRIYDLIDTEPDVDVLVLELIDGRTLTRAINEGLTTAEKLRIGTSIADVLVAAHRANIIHRDLKPDNVMITRLGEVKVLDFGLARWLEQVSGMHTAVRAHSTPKNELGFISDARQTQARWFGPGATETPAVATAVGIAVGTPLYMSPEQARGETLTSASDMYAFGLVLQTLFTGHEPYPAGWSGAEVMMKAAMGESLPVKIREREIVSLINQLKQLAPSDRPRAVDALARLRYIADKPRRLVRRGIAAAAITLSLLGVTKYTIDLRRERALANAAENEARRRRAQADDLISFMVGDLRKKLEPVGRLDVLDAAATKALEYMSSLDPATLSAADLARNAKALSQLGEVRVAQGKLPDATRAFARSVSLARAAVDREPKNAEWQLQYGNSEFWLGDAHRRAGDLPKALAAWREYLAIADRLSKSDPGNAKFQRELGYAHSNVGFALQSQGKLDEALEHYRTSLAIKKSLAERDRLPESRADLANTVEKVAVALQERGDLRGAREQFEKEREIWQELVTADPKHATWRMNLATNAAWLGGLLVDMGEGEAARAIYETELEIDHQLAESDAANLNWRRNLALAWAHLANVDRQAGKHRDALQRFETAELLLRENLAKETRPAWQRDLAAIQISSGEVHVALGEYEKARAVAGEALAYAIRARDTLTAAGGHRILAEVARARGDVETARREWLLASEAIGPVDPAHAEPRVLIRWATLQAGLGNLAGVRAALERLTRIGYRNPDMRPLCAQFGGC